jgi:FlaA1/EpsC-like NDP-sugar epimerase
VVPFFLGQRNSGKIPITHEEMTRFNITLEEGVDMVLYALENSWGGELFVPKIPSYKILDIAKAVAPDCKIQMVGVRPGEKIHEEMITETDSLNTFDCGRYYVINPTHPVWDEKAWCKKFNAHKVPAGFKYNSGTNTDWLSVDEIRQLVKTHVDPEFRA